MKFDEKREEWKFANFKIAVFIEPFDGLAIFKIIPEKGSMLLTIDDNHDFIQQALDYYKWLSF